MIDKAPYSPLGLLEYVGHGESVMYIDPVTNTWERRPVEWIENKPFKAVLTLTGMERGRSAFRYLWKDEYGKTYPMFGTDFLELAQKFTISEGKTDEIEWFVRKRGQNYGIAAYTTK